jgi:ribosomal protein L28
MSRECIYCKRSSQKAVSRSHSNIGTIHRQYANLQKRWIGGAHVLTCTSCLKMVKSKTPHLLKKTKKSVEEAQPKPSQKKK